MGSPSRGLLRECENEIFAEVSLRALVQLDCVQDNLEGRGGDRELPACVVRAARPPHHPQVRSDWWIMVTMLTCDWSRDTWYFTCSCARCEDVTEFGTNLSAFKCQMCCEGLVLPATSTIGGHIAIISFLQILLPV